MPNVSVTIDNGRDSRTYPCDYAFVGLFNEDTQGRWVHEPAGWKGGLGIFLSGLEALKAVAEQEGNERFKVAARAALDAMAEFDPSLKQDEDEE